MGAGEGEGTTYGMILAEQYGKSPDWGESLFLKIGNVYRNELKNRQVPASNPLMPLTVAYSETYSWFFNPSSTLLGIPPVQPIAEVLLR